MSEIGQKLRDARVEKGYTLDDLQQITKIQKRYLIAIEEGHFDQLPGDFYVRAFVKQYADTVGLDSEELLTEFNDTIPQVRPQEETTPAAGKPDTRTASRPSNQVLGQLQRYLPTIIVVVVVIIILGVVFAFTRGNRQQSKAVIDSSSVSVSVQSSSKKQSSSNGSSQSQAKKATKKQTKATTPKLENLTNTTTTATFNYTNAPTTNKLALYADDSKQAWSSVTAGGKTVWQGTLKSAEQTIDLPAGTTSFVIQTGNATNTKAKLNDKAVNLDPKNVGGIVKKITINIQNAANASSSSTASSAATSSSTASQSTSTQSSSVAQQNTTSTPAATTR
ncbi:helix-turn-helix domain-containing protein [Loigolactobacillus backii]|uniref:helix-turn-helix domain-containing protein n=1 Tax=Loigolactobacillus backii TaxID=375175 RepID=UPI00082B5D26|nr:RodZ domain-containing protein [Loigolactobacillus backii]MDA5386555.1 DUF4115 domain-containing protein [Loigolactobacillus backii]MDA5389082.1 DUF4115 domain-containing protein [Loigolactobacillus backii]OLF70837.1 hypothetical protein ACX53_00515 [Loigolactobacillus backii]PIO83913.1 helix-turn-helix domain-containing protein [Loigolactobacillus backii]PIO87331.1 helix-turn-helix domain-containing protein [Loigolactobacillus backii]